MRYIGYEEIDKGHNFPKLVDSLEKKSYPHKEAIVDFLKNGKEEFVQMSRAKDIFNGEVIPGEVLVMSAGDFYWSNELCWYVDKYNLRLPSDFENYILEKQ